MSSNPPGRANAIRLFRSAGAPAGIVLILLVAVLLWRTAVLQQASAAEDRVDQVVVMAAVLQADFLRLQGQERNALLTGDSARGPAPRLLAAVQTRLDRLDQLLPDAQSKVQVGAIRAQYEEWLSRSRRLLQGAVRHDGARYSAQQLNLHLDETLDRNIGAFVEERRGRRMMASHANEDAARSAVMASIAGSLVMLVVLALSWLRAMRDSQREIQRHWSQAQARASAERRSADLARVNDQLRESARMKSDFVAHMSHELRTPLTAIIGVAELLYDQKAGAVSDRQRRFLSDILNSGHHLLDMINEVLDVAQFEAGTIRMHPQQCNPAAVARGVVETMRPMAQEKGVSITTDFHDAPQSVVTDPARLRQILYNYLSNAIKFTEPGDFIGVRLLRESNDACRIEVADTGIGIAPEDMNRLFVDFSQIEGSSSAAQRGAGLGLALTKRMVEMQGGHVGVSSRKGTGSIFFAVLPCNAMAEAV